MTTPNGPPGLWASQALRAEVERMAPLHARLMADPAYQRAQFPADPNAVDLTHPATADLMRQQTAQQASDTDYNARLHQAALLGLKAPSWSS